MKTTNIVLAINVSEKVAETPETLDDFLNELNITVTTPEGVELATEVLENQYNYQG